MVSRRASTERQLAVTSALHHAFLTLGAVTMLSSIFFWTLKNEDGENVTKGVVADKES
jgi:hypothetical protein